MVLCAKEGTKALELYMYFFKISSCLRSNLGRFKRSKILLMLQSSVVRAYPSMVEQLLCDVFLSSVYHDYRHESLIQT